VSASGGEREGQWEGGRERENGRERDEGRVWGGERGRESGNLLSGSFEEAI